MPYKAVVFDIGGVLEHNPDTGWRARWESHLGLRRGELLERVGRIWSRGDIGAISLEELERLTGRALGLDRNDVSALMEDLWREYLGTLNEPLANYFAQLRPRWRTAILSNSLVGAREREQAAYGLEDITDVVVYSHEEGVKKPDPRIYRIVCERLAVSPEEVIFLDDVPACVQGARDVGMTALRFLSTAQATAELGHHLGGPG